MGSLVHWFKGSWGHGLQNLRSKKFFPWLEPGTCQIKANIYLRLFPITFFNYPKNFFNNHLLASNISWELLNIFPQPIKKPELEFFLRQYLRLFALEG
jgi:hypothetical protein